MDPVIWWTLFVVILALDVTLWGLGFFFDANPESQFALRAAAAILLYVVLAMLLGLGLALAIWFAGLWICAIAASAAGFPREA